MVYMCIYMKYPSSQIFQRIDEFKNSKNQLLLFPYFYSFGLLQYLNIESSMQQCLSQHDSDSPNGNVKSHPQL